MYLFTSDFAEPERIKFVWLCKISYSSRFVEAFSTQTKYKSLLADIVLNNKGRITSQPCNILRGSGAISLLACTSHRNRCSLDRWQTYSNKNTRALSLVLYVTSKPLSLNRFAYLCFWMQYVTIFFKSYRIPYNFFFLRMYSFLWKKIFNTFSLWWYCSDLFKIWIFLYSGTRWRYNYGFKRPSEDYYNNIWYNIILIFWRPFANSIFIQVNILNLDFAKRVYLYLMGPICEMCDVFGKYDFFGGGR